MRFTQSCREFQNPRAINNDLLAQRDVAQNQNTHFTVNNFFPKIMRFMRECGQIL